MSGRGPFFGQLSGGPPIRFSGRSRGGPDEGLELMPRLHATPRSTSFPGFDPPPVALSPAYPGRGDGDRAPLEIEHGAGFGTGC